MSLRRLDLFLFADLDYDTNTTTIADTNASLLTNLIPQHPATNITHAIDNADKTIYDSPSDIYNDIDDEIANGEEPSNVDTNIENMGLVLDNTLRIRKRINRDLDDITIGHTGNTDETAQDTDDESYEVSAELDKTNQNEYVQGDSMANNELVEPIVIITENERIHVDTGKGRKMAEAQVDSTKDATKLDNAPTTVIEEDHDGNVVRYIVKTNCRGGAGPVNYNTKMNNAILKSDELNNNNLINVNIPESRNDDRFRHGNPVNVNTVPYAHSLDEDKSETSGNDDLEVTKLKGETGDILTNEINDYYEYYNKGQNRNIDTTDDNDQGLTAELSVKDIEEPSDHPVAMMMTGRKPLSFNSVDYGNIGVVKYIVRGSAVVPY